ncbi:Kinase, AGC [Spironucleus salmonicida]|uniref:non-specific serine/threonine protein kinase n=1 Tax=Spironucleus salmonicida TaxID=348837 RepID=V6LX79_9EUKA|nr:Kinase, AGC [Spironucleus salmonicida]|eukprot:EST48853.1 Kinase, AGC [Spironucleus salmonicida]
MQIPETTQKFSALSTISGNQVSTKNINLKSKTPLPHVMPSDFEIVALLGAGDAGRVYLAKNLKAFIPQAKNQKIFALKVLSKRDLVERNKTKRFVQEYEVLSQLDHPFLARMYAAFSDQRNYYLLMEFCEGGELAQILKKQAFLQENVAKQYVSELLTALEYLHFHGIIYRDLKTENVLIRNDHVKLTDFDLAKQVIQAQQIASFEPKMYKKKLLFPTPIHQSSTSFVGTAEYLSPDVISGQHSQAADFWSLGILIYELLYGKTPFYTPNSGFQAISRRIQAGIYAFPAFPKVSENAKDLIKKLLTLKPENRLGFQFGIAEIKAHLWFKGVNFARIYESENQIQIDFPLQQFRELPRALEVMSRDFAGTGFSLPAGAHELCEKMIQAYEKNGLIARPKACNFDEEMGVENVNLNANGIGTISGAKTEAKRVGLRDLFARREGQRASLSAARGEGDVEE